MTTGGAFLFKDGRTQVNVTIPWAVLDLRESGLDVRIEPGWMAAIARGMSHLWLHRRPLPSAGPAWSATWPQIARALVGPGSVLLVAADGAGVRFGAWGAHSLEPTVEALWTHGVPVQLVEGTWWYAVSPRLFRRRLAIRP
ncbi:MAG: hypothetical protein KJ792_03495 [Actinobacteria bacterium]|nr:hypothetical protein [Actinomycetota bacterium]MCG2800526.1 hypothetical protein [Cellulomonas sp.]